MDVIAVWHTHTAVIGLVAAMLAGRGFVRSELRERIGKLLDEFQDGH